MKTILFVWYIINGTLIPQKNVDGRQTYRIKFSERTEVTSGGECVYEMEVDYAYKGEIYEWIETGTFEYNEDL